MLMRHIGVTVVAVLLASSTRLEAAPTLSLSHTTAAPGVPVSVTVTGVSGQAWALIGSTVNRGFTFGGVALSVGSDVAILSSGTLDASGTVVIPVTPPFVGTTLDRYYVQAVTSASPSFAPLEASAGAVIRNGDLVVPGPPGAPGLAGIVRVMADGTVPAGTSNGGAVANCPSGKQVIGGGVGSGNVNLRIYSSFPSGSGWFGVVKPFDNLPMASSASFTVYAICATVSP